MNVDVRKNPKISQNNESRSNKVSPEAYNLSPSFSHEPELLLYADGEFRINSAGFTVVYTDGSCLSNGSSDAKAAIGVFFGPHSSYNVTKPLPKGYLPSNNTAEILAAIEAFSLCHKHNRMWVEIRTDSKFLIHCVTLHMPVWEQNGWLKTNKKPVSNQLELKKLAEVLKGLRVRWVHVAAHSAEVGNNYADFLARYATFKMMRIDNPSFCYQ